MRVVITISPKPTRGALLDALEHVKEQITAGALAGELDFDHRYIATGQSESDHYSGEWSTDKGKYEK
jgi:hypothetical protein